MSWQGQKTQMYQALAQLVMGLPQTQWKALFHDVFEASELRQQVAELSDDELAAEHYHFFGLNLYPYGHFFLSAEGNLAGEETSELLAFYQGHNFDPEKDCGGLGGTHLGVQLLFLASLSEQRKENERTEFMERFIFSWFPPFLTGAERMGESPFRALPAKVLDLLIQDWRELRSEGISVSGDFLLPPAPSAQELLEEEKTGLKEIASFLSTPAYCGAFLTSHALGKLGKQFSLPQGFGGRRLQLQNLLSEAVRYERFSELMGELSEQLIQTQKDYAELPRELDQVIRPWQRAIDTSLQILQDMKKAYTENSENFST